MKFTRMKAKKKAVLRLHFSGPGAACVLLAFICRARLLADHWYKSGFDPKTRQNYRLEQIPCDGYTN